MINMALAKELKLSKETITSIEGLHSVRDFIFSLIESSEGCGLSELDGVLDNIELRLQILWGWEADIRYIKFWCRPKCTCPKIDNQEAYPTGYYVYNEDCPLHGGLCG